jgi:hypothetical protein
MEENTQPTPAEPTEATTDAATPAEDAAPEAAAEATPEAPVYDWRKALDEAPAEEIRRHPKFAGILGSEKPRWMEEWTATKQAEADAKAKVEAEEALRELARRNPVEFADRWLSSEEVRQQHDRLQGLETNARQDIGRAIGSAFQNIAEFRAAMETDPDAIARLAAAIQGKTDPTEMLGAWSHTAADIVAEKRAQALFEQRITDRLKAERAAWETEAAGRGLVLTDRPGLTRGGRASSADPEPPNENSAEWLAWYRRNTRGVA